MRCQADVAARVAAAPTPQAAASLREGPPDWAPDTRCARPIQDLRCVIPSHDRGRVLLCASVRRCQKCHPPRVLLLVYVTASDLSVEYNRQVQPPSKRKFQASFIARARPAAPTLRTPQTPKKTAHAGRAIRSVCDSRDSIRIAGYPRTSYLHVPRAGVPAGGPRAAVSSGRSSSARHTKGAFMHGAVHRLPSHAHAAVSPLTAVAVARPAGIA